MEPEERHPKFIPSLTNRKPKCCLCRTSVVDVLNLGEIKTCKSYTAHYFCLLLSTSLNQNGADDQGILGFLPVDIRKELTRTKHNVCHYCKGLGASIFCRNSRCNLVFHLPCGIKHKSNHQFQEKFLSQCHVHRQIQKYVKPVEPTPCTICYDTIDFTNTDIDIIWTPCCKKRSYFHKPCLQQMALSTGYFFKCPICNNNAIFNRTVKNYGVFVPNRDASWELEPNAFHDLQYRHAECNAKVCKCKRGRTHSASRGPWTILLCLACGSKGTHVFCSNLKRRNEWYCTDCKFISTGSPPDTFQEGPSTSGTQYSLRSSSNLNTISTSNSVSDMSVLSTSSSGPEILITDRTSNLSSTEGSGIDKMSKKSKEVGKDSTEIISPSNSTVSSETKTVMYSSNEKTEKITTSVSKCPSCSCSECIFTGEIELTTTSSYGNRHFSQGSRKAKKRKRNGSKQSDEEISYTKTTSNFIEFRQTLLTVDSNNYDNNVEESRSVFTSINDLSCSCSEYSLKTTHTAQTKTSSINSEEDPSCSYSPENSSTKLASDCISLSQNSSSSSEIAITSCGSTLSSLREIDKMSKRSKKVEEDSMEIISPSNSTVSSETTTVMYSSNEETGKIATSVSECPSCSCSECSLKTTFTRKTELTPTSSYGNRHFSQGSRKAKIRKRNGRKQSDEEICCAKTPSNFTESISSEEDPSCSYSPENSSTKLASDCISLSQNSSSSSEIAITSCGSTLSSLEDSGRNCKRLTCKQFEEAIICAMNRRNYTTDSSLEIPNTGDSLSCSTRSGKKRKQKTWTTPLISEPQFTSRSISNLSNLTTVAMRSTSRSCSDITNSTSTSSLNSLKESGRGKKRKRSNEKILASPGPKLRSRFILNLSTPTTMSLPLTSSNYSDITNTTGSNSFNSSEESHRGKKRKRSESKQIEKKEEKDSNANKPRSNSSSSPDSVIVINSSSESSSTQ